MPEIPEPGPVGSENDEASDEEENRFSKIIKVHKNISSEDEYSKTCLKRTLKNRQNICLKDKWYLNEGRKYCRMLPLEHSAILLTCIKQ